MTRTEAIALIVENQLATLGEEERQSFLLDWWNLGEDGEEFYERPAQLRTEMKLNDEPDSTPKLQYNALLRVALRHRFIGVRNEYLANRLASFGLKPEVIEGEVEILETCPCCDFRTLSERGAYEICPVCFWEDDGPLDQDQFSGPNHMTLGEGRENFAQFGAHCKTFVGNVLVDGMSRYERG